MNSIILPVYCDRAAAEALLPEMLVAMGNGPMQIDGSAVEQVGQSMLQLLVSARRSGGGAVIVPSCALEDAAQITGLSAELFEASAA